MNKKNSRKHIGLVLSKLPAYSETFLSSKIKILSEHYGKVTLLVDYPPAKNDIISFNYVVGVSFNKSKIRNLLTGLIEVLKGLTYNLKPSVALYKLDKQSGISFKRRVKNLILNQHLLRKDLDWLHFEFGILSVNRENVAKVIGAKMGVSFRGYDLYVSPLIRNGCYNTLFRTKVYYHVLSKSMKTFLVTNGVNSKDISVISPAIDNDFFNSYEKNGFQRPVQILTVARLHWIKALEEVLEALAILKRRKVDFNYTIVGEGKEFERLLFAVHQLGLQNNVSFRGKLEKIEVRDIMHKSDIYVQYSYKEGFCNALLEAQAMGLLCIVSDTDGLNENVIDGYTGWTVNERNPGMLANKIELVINLNKFEVNKIREAAIARVKKCFNLKNHSEDWMKFYEHRVLKE